jgi:hypothetical protein
MHIVMLGCHLNAGDTSSGTPNSFARGSVVSEIKALIGQTTLDELKRVKGIWKKQTWKKLE